jgi:hypothetical protein
MSRFVCQGDWQATRNELVVAKREMTRRTEEVATATRSCVEAKNQLAIGQSELRQQRETLAIVRGLLEKSKVRQFSCSLLLSPLA